MVKLKNYYSLVLVGVLAFFLGLITIKDKSASLVFNIYDTYYNIHVFYFTSILALLYLIPGVIYHLTFNKKFKLIKSLIDLHCYIASSAFFLYFLFMALLEDDSQLSNGEFNSNSLLSILLIIVFSFFILAKLLFVINLAISFFKYLKRKK